MCSSDLDGFLMQVTTQSKEPPHGVFKDELAIARKVRDGQMQLPLLPILYEFPERISKDGGWKNRKYWGLVNPNLGRSVDEAFLANQLTKAEDAGVEALALLASQHFNVEIGLSLRSDRWAGADFWLRRADSQITLDYIIAHCDVAVVGIDGGGLDDLLGLSVIGREKETRRWLCWCRAWGHKIILKRRKQIAEKLLDLEKSGALKLVEDDSNEDIVELADIVERLRDAHLLPQEAAIGADPAGVNDIVDELERRGFSVGDEGQIGEIIQVRQGYTLQDSVKVAERRLAQGTLVHDGSELMAWCVANVKVEQKGNALMVTKQAAGVAKIDPVMALFNATKLMSLNPTPSVSVYEERGLRVG